MEKNIKNYTREISDLTDANKEVYSELEKMSSAIIDKSVEMIAK